MKPVNGTGIDLSDLMPEAYAHCATAFDYAVKKGISEVLQCLFENPKSDLQFPLIWAQGEDPGDGVGNAPVKDPMTLYLSLWDLEDHQDSEIAAFSTSLSKVVDELIEGQVEIDGSCGPEIRDTAAALAEGFRGLADKLDAEMASRPLTSSIGLA